jgi:hypothetical protein
MNSIQSFMFSYLFCETLWVTVPGGTGSGYARPLRQVLRHQSIDPCEGARCCAAERGTGSDEGCQMGSGR